jgi:hypothetical protein
MQAKVAYSFLNVTIGSTANPLRAPEHTASKVTSISRSTDPLQVGTGRHGTRLQHDGVDDAEHGGVDADSEGQGNDGEA